MKAVEEQWNLEWYWDPSLMLLTIHVFPHRTFIINAPFLDGNLFPYLAGLCCFNVILGQNDHLRANINSNKPLPVGLEKMASRLEEVSNQRFSLRFNHLGEGAELSSSTKKVLLFSGGKDSIWQYNHLINNFNPSNLLMLYVSGSTIAGEYHPELSNVKSLMNKDSFQSISVESFDYTSIGLQFSYRPRWRSLILIALARMFSNEIWTGISEDLRYNIGDGLGSSDCFTYFSETPQTLQQIATMLNCDIWLSPPESYCFFDIESTNIPYRSCYSPDIICSPEIDFINSCWKCRTLHIYKKIGKSRNLSNEEKSFLYSDNWPGDNYEDILINATSHNKQPVCITGRHKC